MKIKLEACVESYKEGKRAEELGANRIELCDNLAQGGTTPSYGTILQCKKDINIDINVIIRPRGGNFVYSKEELNIMKNDIIYNDRQDHQIQNPVFADVLAQPSSILLLS